MRRECWQLFKQKKQFNYSQRKTDKDGNKKIKIKTRK